MKRAIDFEEKILDRWPWIQEINVRELGVTGRRTFDRGSGYWVCWCCSALRNDNPDGPYYLADARPKNERQVRAFIGRHMRCGFRS